MAETRDTDHVITVIPKHKMYDEFFTWSCSCGRTSTALFSYRGHAELAGTAHVTSKNPVKGYRK
jgi:hypothetical protein